MAKLTLDSKMKDIMAEPKAVEIIDKFKPGFATNKQLKMVYGMSLRALAKFPQAGMTAEVLAEIEKAFAEIA